MLSTVYHIETNEKETIRSIAKKIALLIAASKVLDFVNKDDFVGVKTHFGEDGNTGHINHELVRAVVENLALRSKNIFLTDTNVLYKNSLRANSVDHLKTAYGHGFDFGSVGAPILIADGIFGRNYTEVDIGKKHFSKVKIASDILKCDKLLVLSHITGHILTGFAGAIKNLGMGCASRRGKYEQHCGVTPDIDERFCVGCGMCAANCPASCIYLDSGKAKIKNSECVGCGECVVVCRTKAIETKWSEKIVNLQEKMVEYAYGVASVLKNRIRYMNFMIKVTKNCDCLAQDEPRISQDAGIMAGDDPVSIDKASADLLSKRRGKDLFKEEYSQIDWAVQLRYAEKIGLGNIDYKLERV